MAARVPVPPAPLRKAKGGNGGTKGAQYWSAFQDGKRIADIAREHGFTAGTVSALIRPFRQAADE